MKKTLIHLNTSPYTGLSCKEGLDLALVLATFEQAVDICVSGAALSLLYENQQPNQEYGKHLHKLLDGLEFYDIENVFIEESSIEPSAQAIWQGVTQLKTPEWHQLFTQYQQVFRF